MRAPPPELPDPPPLRGEDGLTDEQRAALPWWRRTPWGLVALAVYAVLMLGVCVVLVLSR